MFIIYSETLIHEKYVNLKKLIESMLDHTYLERPSCSEILNLVSDWTFDLDFIKSTEDYKLFNLKYDNEFSEYIQKKIFN